jgi:mannose-6-phosphate isomerase-like protein (cupin superfamily)
MGNEQRRFEKPWGFELLWARTDQYVGKLLVIEEGRRLSLQYHREKDEAFLVIRGRMRLHLEDEGGEIRVQELGPGEFQRIAPGRRHRFEALERLEIVEVSTPELDDVVRVDDDYGREGSSRP